MKSLAVDVGNSLIKVGLVPPRFETWNDVQRWADPQDFAMEIPGPFVWWIASVNRTKTRQLIEWLESHRPHDQVHELNWSQVPLNIRVQNPEKVGIDRLLAAFAGHQRAAGHPCIVVDAGTAITVDGVSAAGDFLGGSIFVGVRGALEQLARSTDALPRLEILSVDEQMDPLGRSTAEAIRAGVVLSAAGGIAEIADRMNDSLGKSAKIFLTGGSAQLVQPHLKLDCTYVEHLVMDGIAAVGRRLNNSNE